MKRCIYCKREKDESEFSDEHVLPQAVGGALSPVNPFKTSDVCARCNNLCGLVVDTGFIKNWLTQAGRAREATQCVRFDENAIFPLTYLGPAPELAFENRICEMWLGPTGDSIYHFHEPYPEVRDMPLLVGPAPNLREGVDSGFVFVFVVPSNAVWWLPILRSVAVQFQGSTLYLGNGNTPQGGGFAEIPPRLAILHEHLQSIRSHEHHVRLTVTVDAEVRFLAKFALGLGHLLLEPRFSLSPDGDLLRAMMWARTSDQRAEIRLRGSGFFQSSPALQEYCSWPNGHFIALRPLGSRLALIASFYGRQVGVIQVSETPAHWNQIVPDEGRVYVVSPGLRRFVGPLNFSSFLGHRQGVSINQDLAALENEERLVPPLPPVHLDQVS